METLYTHRKFPTKKALKEAVKAGERVSVYSASVFGNGSPKDGKNTVCGPGPYDRKWYGEITVKDGCITSVK